MIIIDETPQISLKQLRQDGLFEGWYWQRYESHRMTIEVTLIDEDSDESRIMFKWIRWHETFSQYIPLVRVETNLGMGYYRWFFTDYDRSVKFIKAYFNGLRFVPRVDLNDAYYSSQLRSHRERAFDSMYLNPLKEAARIEKQLKKPYRKRHYHGKPTKTQAKLDRDIERMRRYQWQIKS